MLLGRRIAFFLVLIAMTIALMASGCAVGYTDTYPDNGYGPDLVYAAPGVQVIADYDEPIFFSDGLYWRYSGGYWYRSPYYNRGWVTARPPAAVMSINHPQALRALPAVGLGAARASGAGAALRGARRSAAPRRCIGAPPPRAQPQGWRGAPAPAARPSAPPPQRAQPRAGLASPGATSGAAPPPRGGGEHHDHH